MAGQIVGHAVVSGVRITITGDERGVVIEGFPPELRMTRAEALHLGNEIYLVARYAAPR
jgi:hypothetical protein